MENTTKTDTTYPDCFSSESSISYDDQKFICENMAVIEEGKDEEPNANKDASAYESVSGSCKFDANLVKKQSKFSAIENLRQSRVGKIPIKDIAIWLEELFGVWEVKPLHWTFIAERYTPKSINSVIQEMQKRKKHGGMPLEKPGAYFTKVLRKYHKPRKIFRDTNGTCKLRESGKEGIQ